jgi:hypothetical protein
VSHPREREIESTMRSAGAWETSRIAVWELRGDSPVLLAVGKMVESEFEQARQVWTQRNASLRVGRTLEIGSARFIPLRDDEPRLLGFVHVIDAGEPRTKRQAALGEQVLFQLAAALAAPAPDVTHRGASSAGRDADWHARRAELIFDLDRVDWNFAELARRKGVTRQTIFNRTRALEIERPPRPRPGEA